MFTRDFWKEALERALRTMAQFLLVLIGADGAGLATLDWSNTAVMVGGGFVASLLTSILSVSGEDGAISTTRNGNTRDGNPYTDSDVGRHTKL